MMDEKKQIEELQIDLMESVARSADNGEIRLGDTAKNLYDKNYRKQKKGEWLEQVRVSKEGKPLLRHYKCNLCGVYLATQANFCPNCGAKMKGGAE